MRRVPERSVSCLVLVVLAHSTELKVRVEHSIGSVSLCPHCTAMPFPPTSKRISFFFWLDFHFRAILSCLLCFISHLHT
uniref:Putative secreted peptide n=1 Tax=Anopheles braziliensis TaxID=58242 RepID=A0A2M3ZW67_9DIPT